MKKILASLILMVFYASITMAADTEEVKKRSKASRLLFIGMLVGAAVDIGSTEYALSKPGFHEMNPVMGNRGVRISVNIAVPIMLWKMTKDKPVKEQLLFTLPYIGLKAFAGFHNFRVIKSAEKGQ